MLFVVFYIIFYNKKYLHSGGMCFRALKYMGNSGLPTFFSFL